MTEVIKSTVESEFQFDNQIFSCWSIKVFKKNDLVQVFENKKMKRAFYLSSFPENLNLDDVDTFSMLIKEVRENGVDSLKKRFKLKAVKAK